VRLIDVRGRPLLEPEAIVNERLKRQGIATVVPRVLGELLKPVVPTRIGEVGGPPVRSEQHALRHAIAPHLQRPAEDGDSQSSAEEMRRGGEAVGTRADNHYIVDRAHAPFFLIRDTSPLTAPRAKVVVARTAGSGSLQDR